MNLAEALDAADAMTTWPAGSYADHAAIVVHNTHPDARERSWTFAVTDAALPAAERLAEQRGYRKVDTDTDDSTTWAR